MSYLVNNMALAHRLKNFGHHLLVSIHYLLSISGSPVLLVWLLTLPAITPLIQPTLTHSADGLLHLYRLIALDHLIRQGVFFSRWLPDLAYGYGLPLFIFYAPLSYYLTEGLHLLGLDAVGAFNTSTALALLLAGTGVYFWVKDLFGARAGVLAGVAYVYAPYQLFNAFSRGSLPITWAGALFPFVFWAFGRLIRTNNPLYLPLSAFLCGAAMLLHNISSLIFLPLLILYLTIELFTLHASRSTLHASRFTLYILLRIALALVLGLSLAAFFWLPAALEKEFVQVQRVITPPDFDYHTNFVNLSQLFALPPPANTGLLNPTDPLILGLAQAVLAAIGLVSWRLYVQRSTFNVPLLFTTVALPLTIFMMLPISVDVWDRLPLIAFVQQPSRFLSVTALLLAVLTGAAVAALPNRLSFGLSLAGIVLIFISAVPLLYPRYYAALPAPPTVSGMMAYEHASGAIGTTSFGEYLPIWVRQTPRESPLEPLYQTGATIVRLDRAYLPSSVNVETAVYDFNRVDLTINAPQPYQAVFHTFYFPGWQATVDGQPAPLAPVTERGLIGVTMPAGRHQLRLAFTETPLRLAANSLSLLALIIIAILTVKTFNVQHSTSNLQSQRDASQSLTSNLQSPSFSRREFVVLAGLAVALLLTKIVYLDRFDNPLKYVFEGTHVAGVGVSRQVNFGDQVNLLGYDLRDQMLSSGQTFALTLYWQARRPLATPYSALAQLVDEQQHLYAGQDNLHPGNLPTNRWEPWGFAQDQHLVRVPPGTPPGDYFLVAGLYDPATWARLPVKAGGDMGWADVAAIPVIVIRPVQPPAVSELGIVWPASANCQQQQGEIEQKDFQPCLLGATPERESIQRNDFLRIALFWEALSKPTIDYQIRLHLLNRAGVEVLTETSSPSFGRYPTSLWIAAERIRDNHAFRIPADFPAGVYRVQAQLLAEGGQPSSDWLELGQLGAE